METYKLPSELNLNENAVNNLKIFKQRFQIYIEAANLQSATEKRKIALCLNCIGEEALDIYNTFELPQSDLTLKKVFDAFEVYVKPRINIVIERNKFFNRSQKESEPMDVFLLNDLKKLAKSCEFGEQEESLIRDRIIIAINDEALQQRLLRVPNLSLQAAIESCRAAEISKIQQQTLKQGETMTKQSNVDYVKTGKAKKEKIQTKKENKEEDNQPYDCKKCGYRHKRASCQAFGKQCKVCGKLNHFAVGCKSANKNIRNTKKIGEVVSEEAETRLYVDSITEGGDTNKWVEPVMMEGKTIDFKIDTGADCNVLPLHILKELDFKEKPQIHKTDVTVISYTNDKTKAKGYVVLSCMIKNIKINIKFILLDVASMPILGLKTSVQLGLVKRSEPKINEIKVKTEILNVDQQKINFINKNRDLFTGIGTYPDKYEIKLKDDAVPRINPCRRVPETIKDKLKITLDKLEEQNIIEKVEYQTDWVNNIVIVEKPNKSLRICLDPLHLNDNLKRDIFPIPTVDELSGKLTGKKIYTVIDMKDGFHQVELGDKSTDICTFITPFGKYKYRRLPFGLATAPEQFQKLNTKIFGDLSNVGIYFDDLIIGAEDEKEHDKIVEQVLKRARENNVRFNENKLQYKVNEVKYLGLVFNEKGVKPDQTHVKSIIELKEPNNKKELLRILGMVNFLSKFIPNVSEITSPLRNLTKSNTHWHWSYEHTKALNRIKEEIGKAPTLKLLDSKIPITIQADASQNGLGACLLQGGQPVSFVSKSLTETEKKYPQIEKEFLAICFACAKFHQFIYGRQIIVQTDHKPIVSIINKDIHKITPRLQRLKLRLLKYRLKVEYLPGKQMLIADLLSRSYLEDKIEDDQTMLEVVHSLKTEVSMSDTRIQEFSQKTEQEETLKKVAEYFLEGWPKNKNQIRNEEIRYQYWALRDNITYHKGMLFYNERIIVPKALRLEMIKIAHEPHFGIEKTKKRLRQVFYWPKMDKDIENFITSCKTCEIHSRANVKETLIPHDIPKLPFQKVGVDILEYKGESYLSLIDYLSKWIELVKLKNKTAKDVIRVLKMIFSNHGIPEIMICDNMPFSSYQMKTFAEQWSFEIKTSSPIYPKSNGLAEKSVGIAKTILKKIEENNTGLEAALLEYRNLPISGMTVSPAELLMSRKLRTKLPITESLLKPKNFNVHIEMKERQNQQKMYYDRSAINKQEFKKGDNVMIRNGGKWEAGIIEQKYKTPRSYIVTNAKGNTIRRNSFHLKKSNNDTTINKTDVEEGVDENSNPEERAMIVRDEKEKQIETKATRSGRTVKLPGKYKDYELS